MEKVRIAHAPPQSGRIVILGAVLWPESTTLHAVVESDAEEIASELQEGDQATMFQLSDDLGNVYSGPGGGGGSGDSGLHVTDWDIRITPGVHAEATKLVVTIWVRHEIWGTVELLL
jgi:hypothetical protein